MTQHVIQQREIRGIDENSDCSGVKVTVMVERRSLSLLSLYCLVRVRAPQDGSRSCMVCYRRGRQMSKRRVEQNEAAMHQ